MFGFTRTAFLGLVALPLVLAAVHDIQVGGPNGELQFSPEAIFAQPGDQVVFHFNPKNHTATQSSFANPCGLKDGGFDSGFQPVAANQTQPTYTIVVNDTQPIWVYCRQKMPISHCGKGMVFAVNCGADGSPNSFTNFKKAALAIGAASASSAAYGNPTPSATISGAASSTPIATPGGQTHKVIVGGPGKLAFDPPSITAQPNDVVMFEFHQKNHTVTQSSFAQPCLPLGANGTTGFDSGFFPVTDSAAQFPTWSLTVNDTKPIWAYCRQANHCQAGMVFAINAVENSDKNFTAFLNNAKGAGGKAASSTSPSPNGAAAVHVGGTAVIAMAVALFSLML
ncbi:hypothetical protein AX17_000077 [Amanita inopinata Kibby_2008]|nr:hypothetical protein AX17_000077 [Amanita inopinata Kibby_2008]